MSNIGRSVVYRYPDEKGPIYLNITNRCSNSCIFCVREFCLGLSGHVLWLDAEPTEEEILSEVGKVARQDEKEIVWCGFGEPTMRLDILLSVTREMKKRFPDAKVRLNTDGLVQLRNPERIVAKELKEAGVDIVSISLNAESEEKYNELCKPPFAGAYSAMLEFAKACRNHFEVRVSAVKGSGADMAACRRIADTLGVGFIER